MSLYAKYGCLNIFFWKQIMDVITVYCIVYLGILGNNSIKGCLICHAIQASLHGLFKME